MKLYLTGEPCTQQRHCYVVRGRAASFIVDSVWLIISFALSVNIYV